MKKGQIIILNGASSAGKSSLAKCMQAQLKEPYLHMGIDTFWLTMPEHELNLLTVSPEFYTWEEQTIDDRPFLRIIPGPILDRMMIARYQAIVAYLKAGFNVIADDVTWSKLWLTEALKTLKNYRCYFVGLYCDDRVLSHREILRGDRFPGWGRGSQKWVHEYLKYDIVIDSSVHDSETLARRVVASVESNDAPTAADEMRVLYQISK
jgi:chloramphenicol 3-O phosphotransferase